MSNPNGNAIPFPRPDDKKKEEAPSASERSLSFLDFVSRSTMNFR